MITDPGELGEHREGMVHSGRGRSHRAEIKEIHISLVRERGSSNQVWAGGLEMTQDRK